MSKRMIDASIWTNKKYARLPFEARLMVVGIVTTADDQGRIDADPYVLKGKIFAFDEDVKIKQIQEWLEMLATNNTIILYNDNEGEQFAQLVNWWEYQSLQYAQPSTFPKPEGWKDKIRHTFTKGVILTCNWTLTNGVTVVDTCDEFGKPLRKTNEANVGSEQSGENAPDDNVHDDINQVNVQVNNQVNVQPNFNKDKDKDKDKGVVETTRARTHENTRNEQLPPPFSLEDKQPEYRDALPGEYLPGLVAPKRKQVLVVTQTMADAQRLGVEPKEFRLMVDAFLTGCASKPLADAGGQSGEQVLLYAQEQVLQICRVGAQFRSPEGIELIFKSWRENDWRGETVPNSKQVLEHASKMVCGQVVNERRKVTKQQEDNKALFVDSRTRTDIPQYLREALNQ